MKLNKIYYALPIFILAIVMVGFVAVQPSSSLTMDVNPSIEIVTNRLDRVVEINPLNDDAEELLKDFDPKNKNLESTVNDLVDLLILTGHIKGGEDNFVMITVDDDSMDSKLVEKVNNAIAAMLDNKKIEATVLNQAISKSEKEAKLTGVALAAHRLNEIDDSLTAEKIGEMTVRELIHYSKDHNIPIESLFRVASGKTEFTTENRDMISRENAEKIALESVDGEIIKVELDDDEYEIKIKLDGKEYEIEIDAITGKVMKFEVEDDDDYYDDDYKKEDSNETMDRISIEKAKEIAIKKVGGGTITEFESDDDEYEIKIKHDGQEYEIEIDAVSGEVMKLEVEDDDDDYYDDDDEYKEESNEPAIDRLTEERAKAIALAEVEGGIITEFESDDDEFEIEIKHDGKVYEFEIHAFTGDIIAFEVEQDDDYYDNDDYDDDDDDDDDEDDDDEDDEEDDDDEDDEEDDD